MSSETPNAGETKSAETDSPPAGAPKASRKFKGFKEKIEIKDISGQIPRPGDDAMDLPVLQVKNGAVVMRITESEKEKADTLVPYRKLGFSKKKWTATRLMAAHEFGDLMAEKLSARIMALDTFDSVDQLKRAEEFCAGLLNGDAITEVKLAAVKMLAEIGVARVKMQEHILHLAEKARERSNDPSKSAKVLPPVMPTQVLAGQGSQVFVGATSGGTPAISDNQG